MHNDKDIGTYFLRVELENGEGWIETWNTGWRYTDGTAGVTKLDATPIPPTWDNERDLFEAMEYMLTEGNSSCDCNKRLSLARAKHEDDSRYFECGHTLKIARLTAIRPDRTEVVLLAPNT